MLDAASLAAILDPERKMSGLWRERYFIADAEIPMCPREFVYIGPPDLHTAREHAWRLEEWLEARNCRVTICRDGHICTMIYYFDKSEDRYLAVTDPNHTAALVAAIERISNG